jgi:hypothetical protein
MHNDLFLIALCFDLTVVSCHAVSLPWLTCRMDILLTARYLLQVLVLGRANGVEAAAAKTGSSDTRFSELW